MKYISIILFLSFISCTRPKVYNDSVCSGLSMKAYKGFPKAAHEFKKNCGGIQIKYTKDHCQKAFQDLVLVGKEDQLKKKYGDRILECFNERQTNKFLSKKSNNHN